MPSITHVLFELMVIFVPSCPAGPLAGLSVSMPSMNQLPFGPIVSTLSRVPTSPSFPATATFVSTPFIHHVRFG
jgi:hypothetical protein